MLELPWVVMPGSTEYLEELLSRVISHLKQKRGVAKIHDDLYVFADTINDSLSAWESVLQAISDYNLSPSTEKVQILPTTTTLKD